MNKEKLHARLAELEKAIAETLAYINQMQASYNALIGRRDEIKFLLESAEVDNAAPKVDNVVDIDPPLLEQVV